MNRKDTLMTAESMVNGDREQDYGTPEDNFKIIADLWNIYVNKVCFIQPNLIYITPHDVGMMMSLLKHGRIISGQPKPDNYVDACGYLACAAEIATKEEL
jgi:hypothetical protein